MDLNELVRMMAKEGAQATNNYINARRSYQQNPNANTEAVLASSNERLRAMTQKTQILADDIKSRRTLMGIERQSESAENIANIQSDLQRHLRDNPEKLVIYRELYDRQIEIGASPEQASAYASMAITNNENLVEWQQKKDIVSQIKDPNIRMMAELGLLSDEELSNYLADKASVEEIEAIDGLTDREKGIGQLERMEADDTAAALAGSTGVGGAGAATLPQPDDEGVIRATNIANQIQSTMTSENENALFREGLQSVLQVDQAAGDKEYTQTKQYLLNRVAAELDTDQRKNFQAYRYLAAGGNNLFEKLEALEAAGVETGKIQGLWTMGQQMTGFENLLQNDEQRRAFVEFQTALTSVKSFFLKLQSGAAVTEQEYERLSKMFPDFFNDGKLNLEIARSLVKEANGQAKNIVSSVLPEKAVEWLAPNITKQQIPEPRDDESPWAAKVAEAREAGYSDEEIRKSFLQADDPPSEEELDALLGTKETVEKE